MLLTGLLNIVTTGNISTGLQPLSAQEFGIELPSVTIIGGGSGNGGSSNNDSWGDDPWGDDDPWGNGGNNGGDNENTGNEYGGGGENIGGGGGNSQPSSSPYNDIIIRYKYISGLSQSS